MPLREFNSTHMGWLRIVGSIKVQVSFAKEPHKRDAILQKRPTILSILLTVATPFCDYVSLSFTVWCGWCSVLQCVAVCCSVLQCVAVCCSQLLHNVQCVFATSISLSLLQCTAVCCSMLQCIAVCCSLPQHNILVYCSALQYVAVCSCSVLLQCVVAVCCCSVMLQCVAVCCSLSQRNVSRAFAISISLSLY